jgi:hypothetical protein
VGRDADDRSMSSRVVGLGALCALACTALLPAAGASAASASKLPRISSVAPMKLGVGDVLTIRGANFHAGAARNSVVFKRDGSRAVFVTAGRATSTRIAVRVPSSLVQFLPSAAGKATAARFRLRILAGRFSRGYTRTAISPTIGPANAQAPGAPGAGGPTAPATAPAALAPPDCDGDGTPDAIDGDDDDDLLSDTLEIAIGTAPCNPDSDRDGVPDGFEYQSAIDLNNGAGSLPYPGRRPYPNALFADAGSDYDGDGLSAQQEYLLWRYAGRRTLPLSYSAGLKRTAGAVDDDLRDADADDIGNWDEFNGRMSPDWWGAIYKGEKPYTEDYAGTSAVDSDSDGDGVLDGADDTDHDGWTNVAELSRAHYRVQPFNPCLPDYLSPTCSNHPPVDGPYPPFDAPLPPSPIETAP